MESPRHIKKRRSSASSAGGAGMVRGRRRAFGPFHFRYEKLVKQLLTAVEEGDVDTIQECLDAGVDLTVAVGGQSGLASGALHAACEAGHCDSVVTLLNGGACINELSTRDCAPIHIAARYGHLSILALLLSQGASVAATSRFEGRTPLHSATVAGRTACARLLLESGADVGARDIYGSSSLHLAARAGNCALIQLMFSYGADVNSVDKDGWTALHLAAESGQVDAVRELLGAKAQIDCQNKYGRTPLHWAASSGQMSVVKLLLQHNADPTIKDLHGKLADEYASNLIIRKALLAKREEEKNEHQYASTIGLFVHIDQRHKDSSDDERHATPAADSEHGVSPSRLTPLRLTPSPQPLSTPPELPRTSSVSSKRLDVSPSRLSPSPQPSAVSPLARSLSHNLQLNENNQNSARSTPRLGNRLLTVRRGSDSSLISSDESFSGVSSSHGCRSPTVPLVRALSNSSTAYSSDRQVATPSPCFAEADNETRRPIAHLRAAVTGNIEQLQNAVESLTVDISRAMDAAAEQDASTLHMKDAYGRVQTIQESLFSLKQVVAREVQQLNSHFETVDNASSSSHNGFGLVHCFLHVVSLSLAKQADGWRKLLYTTEMTKNERDATLTSIEAADSDTTARTANAVMHWAKWQHLKNTHFCIKSLLNALWECGFNDDSIELLIKDFTTIILPDDNDVLSDKVLGLLATELGVDCYKLAARLAVRTDPPNGTWTVALNMAVLMRWRERVLSMQQLPPVESCALLSGALIDIGREDLLPNLLRQKGEVHVSDDIFNAITDSAA